MKSVAKCPTCKRVNPVNTNVSLTSLPPQYNYSCRFCRFSGFVQHRNVFTEGGDKKKSTIELFKVKKRKVWHVKDSGSGSFCHNARIYSPIISTKIVNQKITNVKYGEYTSKPDLDYVDILEVDEIPYNLHDSLCKACVMQAFEAGVVRVIAND